MAYAKAVLNALVLAVLLGATVGIGTLVSEARGPWTPERKVELLSDAIAQGLNCAALLFLVLAPVVLVTAYLIRRRRARDAATRNPSGGR